MTAPETPDTPAPDAAPETPAAPAPATPDRLDAFLRGPAVVLLSALLFGMVNYVAARHYRRFDLTAAGTFTLSPRSREIARSLREATELYVLLGREEPLYPEVSELAERYAADSSRLAVRYIDPDRQREQLIALAQRLDLQILESQGSGRAVSSAGIVVVRGSRHWEVNREQLQELGQTDEGDEASAARVLNARITVERAVSEALLQVDRARPTRVCFSTGHGELSFNTGDRAAQGLVDDLRHHNFTVEEVEVRGQRPVPDTCDALLIAGTARTWSPEDAAAVERYLRAGGNVGLFTDLLILEGRVAPTGLEGVARMGGIALPAAVTVEADRDHLMPDMPPVHFRADSWLSHDITRQLRSTSIIAAMVRPLTRAAGSEVVPTVLVQTSARAWGEVAIADLLRTYTPTLDRDDVAGPIALAMASEVPGVARRAEGESAGRLVVVGSSTVIEAPYFTLQARATVTNAALTEAIVGWLTARRELVSIPSRPVQRANLLVSERDLRQIGLYVILFVPLAAALVGLAVWRARRYAP